MGFKPPFEVGAVVSNAVLTEAFQVGNMGGMRRSKKTGTIVLISDNTKGLYHDAWHAYTIFGLRRESISIDSLIPHIVLS